MVCLLVIMLGWMNALGQPFISISSKPLRDATHHQEYVYYGANKQYFVVSTFVGDKTLYRIDNYEILDRLQVHEPQEDTLNVCVRQGSTKIMYLSGQIYLTCYYKQGVLDGPLLVHYDDGAIKRRDLYKKGYLKESQCYTQQGEPITCSPLFQPPQLASADKLKHYLVQHLDSLMSSEQLINLRLILTINEIGQVTNTLVESATNTIDARVGAAVQAVIQHMPQLLPNQPNWKPAVMDEVAITDKQIIYLDRRKGFLTVSIYQP